ncbi:MAG TPA: DUF3467 domain-containing protein [Bacteroidales bacterium]|jgi:hypothetical protein|nr:DUF3467 domain-containing protein [Bacteroidales bacterium]HKM12362.1 DUF3467 domain-containing protein [Bacteroidales bacterium]HPB88617.1 DUF3467 domain-containing protein [Bacteroidales bacterium]HPY21356.1 DUF3467 domain-containing protein [Bacteroidales bacterium]HQA92558.1 DUF3467 domain-containing protein [Bacteroidales bacterium]
MEENKNKGISITPEVARGVYSNLVFINHSNSEFVLDFIQVMPGMLQPNVNSRIIMAPEHAKRLLKALEDNVSKYENSFGEINIREPQPANVPPMAFGGEA